MLLHANQYQSDYQAIQGEQNVTLSQHHLPDILGNKSVLFVFPIGPYPSAAGARQINDT